MVPIPPPEPLSDLETASKANLPVVDLSVTT